MSLSKEQFIAMVKRATANIEADHEHLSALDAATGDGDHGVTILRTMTAAAGAVDDGAAAPLVDLLKQVAMKVMMCDGGSTSPLLGSYFMGLAKAAPADELDAEQAAAMFEAGLAGFSATSKASLGDKTMMDALQPATETLAAALREGQSAQDAFAAASQAAAFGAEKTKDYIAKFGRARHMGERALGHIDPGAVSIAHLFRGFAEALA